jgi:hypothetical protein
MLFQRFGGILKPAYRFDFIKNRIQEGCGMDRPLDYTKDYKELYLPKSEPVIIDVPGMPFITIDGAGDPNGEAFAEVVSALYSFSYTIKMSYKGGDAPKGYFPYKVFPLEGVWDLNDKSLPFDKSNSSCFMPFFQKKEKGEINLFFYYNAAVLRGKMHLGVVLHLAGYQRPAQQGLYGPLNIAL